MNYERLDALAQHAEAQRVRDARKRAAHLMRKYGTADTETIKRIKGNAEASELHRIFPCLDLTGWTPKRVNGGTRQCQT
jgi:hypothetical protein